MSFDGFVPVDAQSFGMSGDFYREDDNVVRGVTFPQSGMSDTGHMKDGHMEEVWRKELFGDESCFLDPLHQSRDFPYEGSAKEVLSLERFEAGDKPPNVPNDEFFQLESTTIFLQGVSPVETGNKLLDLFNNGELEASIRKVNHIKFSIKVEVYSEGAMCLLKVRGYQQESKYALEFQRRSGDGIVFNRVYRRAKEWLDVCESTLLSSLPTGCNITLEDTMKGCGHADSKTSRLTPPP